MPRCKTTMGLLVLVLAAGLSSVPGAGTPPPQDNVTADGQADLHAVARDIDQDRRTSQPLLHGEWVEGEYEPAAPGEPEAALPRSARTRGAFESVQVNVDEYGNNITGDAANEPSIAVDPTDRSRIVIGWRQFDTTASDFRQAGWAYSHDSGQNWTFPGVLEPGVFRSDPVLAADLDGNIYSLQPDYRIQHLHLSTVQVA